MIVVRVELWSAITGKVTELARMDIANIGGTDARSDYRVRTIRGRDKGTLDKNWAREMFTRNGTVNGYPRKTQHVWNLVSRALQNMNYGISKRTPNGQETESSQATPRRGLQAAEPGRRGARQ